MTTFPPLQFAFYGLPYQVGSLLALGQNGVHTLKGAFRKAGRHLLVIDLFSAHGQNIADITYCYKGRIR